MVEKSNRKIDFLRDILAARSNRWRNPSGSLRGIVNCLFNCGPAREDWVAFVECL
jgi:hypothetical protein